mmetsp:Transcript_40400/g.95708  ORF Transcript_40400/g.95708 Transcript_40400/m.95708 type:complete len:268 (+) Transcript_40400:124-927(+)
MLSGVPTLEPDGASTRRAALRMLSGVRRRSAPDVVRLYAEGGEVTPPVVVRDGEAEKPWMSPSTRTTFHLLSGCSSAHIRTAIALSSRRAERHTASPLSADPSASRLLPVSWVWAVPALACSSSHSSSATFGRTRVATARVTSTRFRSQRSSASTSSFSWRRDSNSEISRSWSRAKICAIFAPVLLPLSYSLPVRALSTARRCPSCSWISSSAFCVSFLFALTLRSSEIMERARRRPASAKIPRRDTSWKSETASSAGSTGKSSRSV